MEPAGCLLFGLDQTCMKHANIGRKSPRETEWASHPFLLVCFQLSLEKAYLARRGFPLPVTGSSVLPPQPLPCTPLLSSKKPSISTWGRKKIDSQDWLKPDVQPPEGGWESHNWNSGFSFFLCFPVPCLQLASWPDPFGIAGRPLCWVWARQAPSGYGMAWHEVGCMHMWLGKGSSPPFQLQTCWLLELQKDVSKWVLKTLLVTSGFPVSREKKQMLWLGTYLNLKCNVIWKSF